MLADRSDIADEVKVELEHRRVECMLHGNQEQRVTIGRCPHDRLGGNIAASASAVLDDKWLPKSLRQPLTDQACDDVRSSNAPQRTSIRALRPSVHPHSCNP